MVLQLCPRMGTKKPRKQMKRGKVQRQARQIASLKEQLEEAKSKKVEEEKKVEVTKGDDKKRTLSPCTPKVKSDRFIANLSPVPDSNDKSKVKRIKVRRIPQDCLMLKRPLPSISILRQCACEVCAAHTEQTQSAQPAQPAQSAQPAQEAKNVDDIKESLTTEDRIAKAVEKEMRTQKIKAVKKELQSLKDAASNSGEEEHLPANCLYRRRPRPMQNLLKLCMRDACYKGCDMPEETIKRGSSSIISSPRDIIGQKKVELKPVKRENSNGIFDPRDITRHVELKPNVQDIKLTRNKDRGGDTVRYQ